MLGYVLARAEADANGIAFEDAASYEDLVREKVLNPMGMHDTVVKFEPETAAVACSRGDKRDTQTIRLGEYDVLQGNGALYFYPKSTQFDFPLLYVLYKGIGFSLRDCIEMS